MDTLNSNGKNMVIPHEDYIEVVVGGPQNRDTINETGVQTETASKDFTAKARPVLILVRLLNIPTKPNLGAFEESMKIYRAVPIKRMAICGRTSSMVSNLIDMVVSSFSHELEIRHFTDDQEALAWLNRKPNNNLE